jgi:hypothetical protein
MYVEAYILVLSAANFVLCYCYSFIKESRVDVLNLYGKEIPEAEFQAEKWQRREGL